MKLTPIIVMIATILTSLILSAAESQPTKLQSQEAAKQKLKEGSDKKEVSQKHHRWQLSQKSVVKVKGVDLGERSCSLFQVHFDENLSYQINCGEFSVEQNLALNNSKKHTVTRKNGYTTITKYGYLIKKPQISQLDQTTLRVPYVSQIIHINENDKNEMAFYLESFKVDEFGRIVQDQFIQAHGLAQFERRVSAHKIEKRKNNK
jgi:hypothetical protein